MANYGGQLWMANYGGWQLRRPKMYIDVKLWRPKMWMANYGGQFYRGQFYRWQFL